MSNVDQILSLTDAGDDMQRRLRYQASYGALLCLDLLIDEEDGPSEIFCEHHEDFLVKTKSGKYVGVQVKTRVPGQGPFKSGDDAVKNALSRFIELELLFPNQFVRFVLVANCDFYDAGETETNLAYALELIRNKPKKTFSGTMKVVLEELRKEHKCKKTFVIDALKKVALEGKVPKFEDMTAVVITKAARLRPDIAEYRAVEACANALINKVLKASALSCDQPIRSHFIFTTAADNASVLAVISNKRIVASDVLNVLGEATSPLLMPPSEGNVVRINIPTGYHVLEKKMAAGGISAPSISAARDQQTAAEYVLQEWVARYGAELASQRRNQVDLLVNTRCSEAHDKAYSSDVPFGPPMLSEVRAAMRLLSLDKGHVFGLKYEQLLGFVSLSTQACRIWWTDPFSLEDPNAAV